LNTVPKKGVADAQWEYNQRNLIRLAYDQYILELIKAQEEERKAEGLL
jgi:hypothetical protein